MSTVLKKGTLTEVFHTGDETVEGIARRLLTEHAAKNRITGKNREVKLKSYHDNFLDQLAEELFEEYILIDGTIYSIEEEELHEIYEARQNGNGQYEYTVKYNDSGMAHPDAIREALDTIETQW